MQTRPLARSVLLVLAISLASATVAESFEPEIEAHRGALGRAVAAVEAAAAQEEQLRAHAHLYARQFQGQDPWHVSRRMAIEWYARQADLKKEWEGRRAACGSAISDVERTGSALRAALRPIHVLRAEALAALVAIEAGCGDPSNGRRAAATIRRDLPRLDGSLPLDNLGAVLERFIVLMKLGQPPHAIQTALQAIASCDASRAAIPPLVKLAADCSMQSAPERIRTISRTQGYADRAGQALRILRGTALPPGQDRALARMTHVLDLAADLIPVAAIGMKAFLMLQSEILKSIHEGVRALNLELARRNLHALVLTATCRDSRLAGAWPGVHPAALFGSLEPDPLPAGSGPAWIRPSRRHVYPGDAVRIDFAAPAGWSPRAWIGLVPDRVPHGDAVTADAHDVAWAYVDGRTRGFVTLRAPGRPGWYDFRMFDDYSGREICSVTVRVLEAPFGLALSKDVFQPGERIVVRFGTTRPLDPKAWVGVVPAHVRHGSEAENDRHDVSWRYLDSETSGLLEFRAPEESGEWSLRMHDRSGGGREIASVVFRVERKAKDAGPRGSR